MNIDDIKPLGTVYLKITYQDGRVEYREKKNALLNTGRAALTHSLANQIGDQYEYYINRMIFGDGGTSAGVPKVVAANRTGLFGAVRVNKPVIANIPPEDPSQVIFTATMLYEDGNDYNINEMALQMYNGDLYSMCTFGDIAKTSSMQITFNWVLQFI